MMTSPGAGCTMSEHMGVFGDGPKMATDVISADGQIISCIMCMKHFGVEEPEFISDTKSGNPEKNGTALVHDNGKSLSWQS